MVMRVEKIIVLLGLCLLPFIGIQAEDRKPETQIADNTFFDPTRKPKEESYHFSVEYRIEAGYVQHEQRTKNLSYPNMFLHGGRIGATFNFILPMHFSLQTGLYYTLLYGKNTQHWRSMDAQSVQEEYIRHKVLEHNLTVPVRVYYTIPVWRQLRLFVYTGPQLHIGLAENDYMQTHLSDGTKTWLEGEGIPTEPYDRFSDELVRANIQWGLGGGIEWDCYRLQSGYDFGLNNLVRHPKVNGQHMWEWGWFVTFSYRF